MLRVMIQVEGPCRVWVDDFQVAEVDAQGTARPIVRDGLPPQHDLYKQWIELYHGEGRPYLQFGEAIPPPSVEPAGAVQVGAFRAADGSEAVIAVNATDAARQATLRWDGKSRRIELMPGEVKLVLRQSLMLGLRAAARLRQIEDQSSRSFGNAPGLSGGIVTLVATSRLRRHVPCPGTAASPPFQDEEFLGAALCSGERRGSPGRAGGIHIREDRPRFPAQTPRGSALRLTMSGCKVSGLGWRPAAHSLRPQFLGLTAHLLPR